MEVVTDTLFDLREINLDGALPVKACASILFVVLFQFKVKIRRHSRPKNSVAIKFVELPPCIPSKGVVSLLYMIGLPTIFSSDILTTKWNVICILVSFESMTEDTEQLAQFNLNPTQFIVINL